MIFFQQQNHLGLDNISEAHSEPDQTSKMEFFANVFNDDSC